MGEHEGKNGYGGTGAGARVRGRRWWSKVRVHIMSTLSCKHSHAQICTHIHSYTHTHAPRDMYIPIRRYTPLS